MAVGVAALGATLVFSGLRGSPASVSHPPPPAPAPPTTHPEPSDPHYAVATQHPLATRAAMEMLRRGGSAADAAIAATLVLGVVAPDSSGLGGGGFAVVWEHGQGTDAGRPVVLDFREEAPAGLRPDLLEQDLVRPQPGRRGLRVGVPGELAGLVELHSRYGKIPFAAAVQPAIDLAEGGFAVGPALARNSYGFRKEVSWSPLLRDTFERGGDGPVFVGYRIQRPSLASTLRRIAQQGNSAFYEGPVAAEIAKVVRDHGGAMTPSDLHNYRVVERPPLDVLWDGYEVVTVPPPSAGGLLLAETLAVLSPSRLRATLHNSGEYIHALGEAFRKALADRIQDVGDPRFVPARVTEILSPRHVEHLRTEIAPHRTRPLPGAPIQEHGTSHLVVVDEEGNVVSMTTTVGNAFGSRIATPESGIILNDELVDFTTQRQYERFSRRRTVAPNAPRPGARPVSSMTPTIVLRDGKPVLAAGGAGGLRIGTGVTQAILSTLVFGLEPANAVSIPRFHTPYEGYTIELEYGLPQSVAADLRERGERVDTTANFSAVQMVTIGYDEQGAPNFAAAADPRFSGSAEVR